MSFPFSVPMFLSDDLLVLDFVEREENQWVEAKDFRNTIWPTKLITKNFNPISSCEIPRLNTSTIDSDPPTM